MILDTGICTIFRKVDISEPGRMPSVGYVLIGCSWYGRLNYETSPVWQTDGRQEQRVDKKIRILQNTMIAEDDVCILEELASFEERSEDAVVYRIIRAYHGQDDNSPDLISDLSLEVVQP